ncbi:MAG: flippase-like domain-containing protein [Nitrospirae bacterium]|nr:flippase-like domain-containing protein [Nitrospirota bacterium]
MSDASKAGYKDKGTLRISRYIILIGKLLISFGLIYFLISKIGGRIIIDHVSRLNPLIFITACGAYLFMIWLSSVRWNLLIPHKIKTSKLFSIYMIGSFFNTYMPGIIGGDAVKAYYLSKELKSLGVEGNSPTHELSIAIASVFMDRYIGFTAILFISMAAFPLAFAYLDGTPVRWLMPIVLVVFIGGSIVIFKFRIGERIKFLFRVYEYFHLYSRKRDVLLKAFIYSVILQGLNIGVVYFLSRGLSLEISFFHIVVFLPIIILISFIPVSISGIGLREGAFIILLGTAGVSPEMSVALSLVWFLSYVIASLVGLFEYLRLKPVLDRQVE